MLIDRGCHPDGLVQLLSSIAQWSKPMTSKASGGKA